MQCANPVTYLLEDYREKSVAGAFYEHELHRSSGRVSRRESTAQEGKQGMSSGWDSMDRTIHGYTKTMLFDKILIHIFHFYI